MRLIKVRAVMWSVFFLILTIYKLVQAPQGHLPAFSHTHDLFIKIDTTNVCRLSRRRTGAPGSSRCEWDVNFLNYQRRTCAQTEDLHFMTLTRCK